MKEIGIIGYPLGHTLSPKIHEAGFRDLKLDIKFNVWEIKKDSLKDQIEYVRQKHVLGTCVTLPHKHSVIDYIDDLDESAKEMGAVNWIINRKGKLIGHNTDCLGFSESVKFHGKSIKNKNCLILGAGGSAKAVCMALIKQNAKEIHVSNRTESHALKLVDDFKKFKSNIQVIKSEQIQDKAFVNNLDVIINTTSVGMAGGPAPSKSPINTDIINRRALCYDLVYSPEVTPFISGAAKNNIETIGGLAMLVFQAALGFELVTEEKAPINKMLEAVGITD